jgi:hypothetical protein
MREPCRSGDINKPERHFYLPPFITVKQLLVMRRFFLPRLAVAALPLLLLGGCIGTDFVDELIGPDLSRVEIDQRAISVLVNETSRLSALYYGITGEATMAEIRWSSKNESIARVNSEGLVTGVAPGQTEIVAEVKGMWRDSALVTVAADPNAVALVSLSAASTRIGVGETLPIDVEVRNAEGGILQGYSVQWRSSAPQVATIDERGLVRGVAPGSTAITAIVDGISSPALTIQVAGAGRSGSFVGRGGYSASGAVTVLREGDGFVVRLEENFRTQTGPGLHVYLGKSASSAGGAVDLGRLKATSGLQTYAVPANINPDDFSHVLIYCQPFSVVFASAELK